VAAKLSVKIACQKSWLQKGTEGKERTPQLFQLCPAWRLKLTRAPDVSGFTCLPFKKSAHLPCGAGRLLLHVLYARPRLPLAYKEKTCSLHELYSMIYVLAAPLWGARLDQVTITAAQCSRSWTLLTCTYSGLALMYLFSHPLPVREPVCEIIPIGTWVLPFEYSQDDYISTAVRSLVFFWRISSISNIIILLLTIAYHLLTKTNTTYYIWVRITFGPADWEWLPTNSNVWSRLDEVVGTNNPSFHPLPRLIHRVAEIQAKDSGYLPKYQRKTAPAPLFHSTFNSSSALG